MEPESSFTMFASAPNPYPEPDKSSTQLSILPKIGVNIVLPSSPRLQVASPLHVFQQNVALIFYLSHACYMPAHLILLDLTSLIIFCEIYKL
jgi:hypothetical protein